MANIPTTIDGIQYGQDPSTVANPDVAVGQSAPATNATTGFLQIAAMAGVPSGVPSAIVTGFTPIVVDTTDGRLYAYYAGAWNVLPALSPRNGLDNRTGLTAADGAPITLYTPASANQLIRITADIFATAFTSGTATYTLTWTENAVARTMVVTATALNTLGTATDLIRPDNATAITAQLTGVFTATVTVAGVVERLA